MAMGKGPASTVTLIYASGFLIPIFYGIIFWEESVSPFQWLGVVLLTVALTLCVLKKEKKRRLIAWLPFAVFAMLGSGLNAILQKTHQLSAFSEEISFYLVYSLFFSALFTGLICPFITRERGTESTEKNKSKTVFKRFLLPTLLGVSVGVLNFLNLTLSGKLASVILFPIYNVGSMLLINLICALVYKEKMTVFQKIGFAVGIIAILIIGLL
jgi:drug/metabolite transporter (DMT)-like permease